MIDMLRFSLPWTVLGLPGDFRLRHIALGFTTGVVLLSPSRELRDPKLLSDPKVVGELNETFRFGHVTLPTPIIHPLLLVHTPEWLTQRTGVSSEGVRQLVDHQRWVVIDAASDSGVEVGSLIEEAAIEELEHDAVELATGVPAIERLLAIRGHTLPVSLTMVRVLPIGFRPRGRSEGRESAALSDIDQLYGRVINRAFRLRRLQELEAPEIIVRNEIIMAQAALESLFCNEARESPTLGGRDRPLQSLLGLAGGPAIADSLHELDTLVGHAGPKALSDSLPEAMPRPLLRTVRIIQALHLQLSVSEPA